MRGVSYRVDSSNRADHRNQKRNKQGHLRSSLCLRIPIVLIPFKYNQDYIWFLHCKNKFVISHRFRCIFLVACNFIHLYNGFDSILHNDHKAIDVISQFIFLLCTDVQFYKGKDVDTFSQKIS